MGSRDFRHHETKKPKKGSKKTASVSDILQPPPSVEVIGKKGKKNKDEEAGR